MHHEANISGKWQTRQTPFDIKFSIGTFDFNLTVQIKFLDFPSIKSTSF